jgi:hypothetical protein
MMKKNKGGRPRKTINDLEMLYDHDPDMMLTWFRKTGGVWFELKISAFIERWINHMDKKRYQEIKAIID